MATGIDIDNDGRLTLPCDVFVIERKEDRTVLNFIIHEGRNRQIRKMIEHFGYEVKSLKISDMQITSSNVVELTAEFAKSDIKDAFWYREIGIYIIDPDDDTKEINICYTIPNRHISRITNKDELDNFLQEFVYYNIKVERTDKTKQVRENNILIVKNAAINYLKHLKQYKHGLENEESYKLFHNLLINECRKEGFELKEEEMNLMDIPEKELSKIKDYLEEDFYNQPLSKQVHIIENIVWQSSNDLTLLDEYIKDPNPDSELIIICGKKYHTAKSKFINLISKHGEVINLLFEDITYVL